MELSNTDDPDEPPVPQVAWDIRRGGRAWGEEAMARYQLTPEKFEMVDGKLFWSHADRVTLLGLLLENVGTDAAVRLGDPAVWRAAIREPSWAIEPVTERSLARLEAELAMAVIELRAQREALGGRMDAALANQTAELIKWMFLFCLGVIASGMAVRLF